MDTALLAVLNATSRFEFLIAKREYEALVDLMKAKGDEGDKFRRDHVAPHEKTITSMLRKCDDITLAFKACGQDHEGWTLGSSQHGVTTKYFVDESGFINMKVEGEMKDLPLYEQLVVIWEVALYHLWVPYCSESKIIKSFDNSEFITTMTMNPPFGITRDIVVHAFGANCLSEQNSLVLVTKSLTDSPEDKELTADCSIPPVNKGFFSDRVHLHYLYCVNTMTSSSSTKFNAVMRFDPKLGFGLPGTVMSWFINQLAGVVFPLLRKQAINLAEADPYNNSYTNQIRNSSSFYMDFLLPIYRCYVQQQGWPQPTIRCLYDKGIPQNNVDYSVPFTLSDAASSLKLSIRLPPTKRKMLPRRGGSSSPVGSPGGSPGGRSSRRSNSVVSADFYSCYDDDEYVTQGKKSVDWTLSDTGSAVGVVPVSRKTRAPLFDDDVGSSSVLDGSEIDEPFLEDRSLIKTSGEECSQKPEEGASSKDSCCAPWRCCLRWLCCVKL